MAGRARKAKSPAALPAAPDGAGAPEAESQTPAPRQNSDGVQVIGARENNLKALNVFIPRNKITVITGLSGSGKSTLAFDTIYGEGQRRFLESLSVHARYFIDQMKRAKVDMVYGLSPSIAISQKTVSFNPRSTVGTVTEAYDFLRLLYARLGEALCPAHKMPLQSQSGGEILHEILKSPAAEPVMILSPIARGKKGSFAKELSHCLSLGFDRARIDGQWKDLGGFLSIEPKKEHNIEVLLDHLTASPKHQKRIQKAMETALSLSEGRAQIETQSGSLRKSFSLHLSCPKCDYSFLDMDPKLFSFNSPQGACGACNGTGLAGLDGEEKADEDEAKKICRECHGARLCGDALQVRIQGRNIAEVSAMPSEDLRRFFKSLKFTGIKQKIFEQIAAPLLDQLSFLKELSLGYLSLDRALSSLSGGEAQRLRLVSQLSSPLIGALYVLDEPSIGLHPKDHSRILDTLKSIRDRGNTVVLVEHDEESISRADKIIDLGPGAGVHGGFVVAEGAPSEIKKNPKSLTGAYMSRKKTIPYYESSYTGREPVLSLKGASLNNLKNINVNIPLGCLVGISGVSGSGKSTLITDTVYPILEASLREGSRFFKGRGPRGGGGNSASGKTAPLAGLCQAVSGLEHIERALKISQKPIGKSPRSNPVTYMGIFHMIRSLFAQTAEARARGYGAGHFSFNIHGGRCEPCMGTGFNKLEMRFLPDVFTVCEFCGGKRFQPEILAVTYRGKSISDIMEMTVAESEEFFKNHIHIHYRLKFLKNMGLGYLTLGQGSNTLSGGEAQRLKLAKELAKKNKGHTLYILDEPTTGLHFHDVARLIEILRELKRQGHSILVIEHNLDALKSCDYLIDLGPEAGERGGSIAAEGTPRQVSKNSKSHTGRYLKSFFESGAAGRPAPKKTELLLLDIPSAEEGAAAAIGQSQKPPSKAGSPDTKSRLKKARPKKASSKGSRLKKARSKKSRSKGSRLKKAQSKKASSKGSRLKKARLKKASPKGSRLKKARLKKAQSKKASSKASRLKKSRLKKAGPKASRLKKAQSKKARLKKARPQKKPSLKKTSRKAKASARLPARLKAASKKKLRGGKTLLAKSRAKSSRKMRPAPKNRKKKRL